MDEFDSGDKGVAAPAPAPGAGDDGNSAPLPETVSVASLRLPLRNFRCLWLWRFGASYVPIA
jgi:hypothetical protein